MPGTFKRYFCLYIILLAMLPVMGNASDSIPLHQRAFLFSDKLFTGIERKCDRYQNQLQRSNTNLIRKLQKEEYKLIKKLSKKDSVAAKNLLLKSQEEYAMLMSGKLPATSNNPLMYSGSADSMSTAIKFIDDQYGNEINHKTSKQLKALTNKYKDVQQVANHTKALQDYLKAKQENLSNTFSKLGVVKELDKYKSKVYQYRSAINEYRDMFDEPKKLEKRLLQTVTKIPAFNKFFNKNSLLASMFQLPGSTDPAGPPVPGLQTREAVSENLENRFGSGVDFQNRVGESINTAQSSLDKMKSQVMKYGQAGADLDTTGFKPKGYKSKNLFKNIELGTNIQSVKGSMFLPVTSDIGLSIGYTFIKKGLIGVGISYKVGWGKDIRHISISHEGFGLRSFLEYKVKGSMWVMGGWEYNHLTSFKNIEALKKSSQWQESALVGFTKKISFRAKTKAGIQVMYDFLYRDHYPQSQPIITRIQYSIK